MHRAELSEAIQPCPKSLATTPFQASPPKEVSKVFHRNHSMGNIFCPITSMDFASWFKGSGKSSFEPHLPLRNAACMLCRKACVKGEKVAAVQGEFMEPKLQGLTSRFVFPDIDSPLSKTHVPFHDADYGNCKAELCRERPSDCQACKDSRSTYLWHVECWDFLRAIDKDRPVSVPDIWIIGTWTQVVCRRAYPPSNTLKWLHWDLEAAELTGPLPAVTRHFPPALRRWLARVFGGMSIERVLAVTQSMEAMTNFLDRSAKIDEFPLIEIMQWQREAPYKPNGFIPSPNSIIRIYIDDYGPRYIEILPAGTDLKHTARQLPTDTYYVVEKISSARIRDAKAEIKGNHLRIHNAPELTLWDVPDPPVDFVSWHNQSRVPRRIHCVDLRGCRGLTFVFSQCGWLKWIHPQYRPANGIPDDFTLPVEQQRQDSDQMRIYLPLTKNEKIVSFSLLRSPTQRGINTPFLGLHVVTNKGRSEYIGPHNVSWYNAPLVLADRHITHICMSDEEEDRGCFNIGFVTYPPLKACDPHYSPVIFPFRESLMPPLKLPRTQIIPDGYHMTRLMLRKATTAWTFIRPRPGLSSGPETVGMLVRYQNGAMRMLGKYQPTDGSERYSFPIALHWKPFADGDPGVDIRISTRADLDEFNDNNSGGDFRDIMSANGWMTKLRNETVTWCCNVDGDVHIF